MGIMEQYIVPMSKYQVSKSRYSGIVLLTIYSHAVHCQSTLKCEGLTNILPKDIYGLTLVDKISVQTYHALTDKSHISSG
jgi:hypothetical protein